MTEEKTITWSALRAMAPEDLAAIVECDPNHSRFLGWAALDPAIETTMVRLGKLVADDSTEHSTLATYPGSNYWSPDDPIALAWYPYNGCEVFQKNGCASLYLVYSEYGGHYPEKRARLVRKSLIVTEERTS